MSTTRMRRAMVCGRMVNAPEGDYYVACSFDSNHIVLRSRMPYHIVKCLRQNKGHTKMPCPYDFTEYIEKNDMKEHMLHCEFRSNTCDGSYAKAELIASGKCGNTQPAPFFHDLPPPEEDWGDLDFMAAQREEEERIRREAQPEKVIDPSSSEEEEECEVVGVGRGVRVRRNLPPPPRGMGRAEVMRRILKQYEELKARDFAGLVNRPSEACATATTPGQFDN